MKKVVLLLVVLAIALGGCEPGKGAKDEGQKAPLKPAEANVMRPSLLASSGQTALSKEAPLRRTARTP